MPEALPPLIQPVNAGADADHLRLLSIFHYIVGALHIVGSSAVIIHFSLGLLMLLRPGFFGNNPPPPFVGVLLAVVGAAIVLCGWAIGVCTIYSGRCIQQRVRRTFSVVIAAVNCPLFPFGTALGVFTLMVLMRDSVRRLYGAPMA